MLKNKLLPVLLSLLLCTSLCSPAAASTTQSLSETSVLNVLAALEVMNGDENGSLNLESPVTRAEFTKMMIAASTAHDTAAAGNVFSPYSDVKSSHWAAGYIKTARDLGLLNGYLDGSFRPNNTVTLEEAATIALKNLGYTDSDFAGVYPNGQLALYRSLNLSSNINATQGDSMTRRQCAWLIYNMLNAKIKTGQVLAETLGYQLDESGHIDYVALLNDNITGPYIVQNSGWQSTLGFTPTKFYRNDRTASAASITTNDVIYYSEPMQTVWAYSAKKTGTFESASPSRANPSAITISGVNYTLGTSEAAYAFSNLGGLQLGQSVTVLLGRDGSVVGLMTNTAAATTTQTPTGIVTDSSTKSYTDSAGNTYKADYINVLSTDGVSYEYQTDKNFTVGALVEVTTGTSTTISRLSSATVSGTVDSTGSRLGSRAFADDVEILDVYQTTVTSQKSIKGKTLHSSRLTGAKISSSDVLYYATNDSGEITRLILNNFSGDLYTYGIMTDIEENGSSGSYEYVSNGETATLRSTGTAYNIEKGAFGMMQVDGQITTMVNLSEVRLSNIAADNTAEDTSGTTRLLSDTVQIYESRDGEYYLTSAALLDSKSYTLRGFYDKSQSSGGRIRVVIAVPK